MQKFLIMIVDDDPVFNNMIASLVKKMGHQTMQAFSAAEAANVLFDQQIKPDLLLCEAELGGKSGFELVRESIVKNIDLNICILSGKNERQNRLEALQLGALDFISKPVTSEKFTQQITKLIGKTIVLHEQVPSVLNFMKKKGA